MPTPAYRTKSEKLLAKERKCIDKKTYHSEEDATGAGIHMEKLFGERQYSYFCGHCNFYHLSKKQTVDTPDGRNDLPSVAEVYRSKIEEFMKLERPSIKFGESLLAVEVNNDGDAVFNNEYRLGQKDALSLSLWLKETFSGVDKDEL